MVQAVSRSPPAAALGSEFASRSLHMGFVMDETRSAYVFLWVCPVLSGLKFHSTICPYSSRLFHFISSAPVMVRQTWSASILAIHKPSIKELNHIHRPGFCRTRVVEKSQSLWSRGYHTRHWIRGSWDQTRPGSMGFFRV